MAPTMNMIEALVNLGFASSQLHKATIQVDLEILSALKKNTEAVRALSVKEAPFRKEIEGYGLPLSCNQSLALDLDGRSREVEVHATSTGPLTVMVEGTIDDEHWFPIYDQTTGFEAHLSFRTACRRVRVSVPKVEVAEGEEPGVVDIVLIAT